MLKHSAPDTVVSWAVNQISKKKKKRKTKLQNGKMTRTFVLGTNSENLEHVILCVIGLLISKTVFNFPLCTGVIFYKC